jgi:hypothetical protein
MKTVAALPPVLAELRAVLVHGMERERDSGSRVRICPVCLEDRTSDPWTGSVRYGDAMCKRCRDEGYYPGEHREGAAMPRKTKDAVEILHRRYGTPTEADRAAVQGDDLVEGLQMPVVWVCEQHPGQEFPHGDCAGPGMLLRDSLRHQLQLAGLRQQYLTELQDLRSFKDDATQALAPVRDWYDGDGTRTDVVAMLTDAIADLQDDRAALLSVERVLHKVGDTMWKHRAALLSIERVLHKVGDTMWKHRQALNARKPAAPTVARMEHSGEQREGG